MNDGSCPTANIIRGAKPMYCRLLGLMAALFLIIPAGALAQQTPAQKGPDKLRYGQIVGSVKSVSSLGLHIAQRKGFLTRENIDLQVVRLPGVHHMIEGLDKNTVDLSHTALPYLVEGVLKGSNAAGVVGGPANTIFSVLAKPLIKSFSDLKGKMIAMSLPVDTISIATLLLLEKHGLKPADYRTTELIGTQTRAKCLLGGECDAVPLGQPDDIAFAAKGYTKLGDSTEVIPVLQFSVTAARRDWAAQNKDVVVRFARAFGNAYRFMRDPKQRDEVVRILGETTDAPPEVAQAMLAFYYEPDRGVMPKQAEISMPGITKVIELLGLTGTLQAPLPAAERFVDLQYLQAAGLQ
jgi:ABC-type nitrate/sulfonate/bicarbonate transport system substrate-binding protein